MFYWENSFSVIGYIQYLYVVFLFTLLYFYVSFIGTYNTAVKAAKTVLEGGVAQTEAETDYNQPRKRKKNKKYISSSEDEEMNNFSNIYFSW